MNKPRYDRLISRGTGVVCWPTDVFSSGDQDSMQSLEHQSLLVIVSYLIVENTTNSDSSCTIIRIIEDIKNKKKKPDKDSIKREAIQQGLSQDTLVSLLLNAMVSEG